MNTRMNPTQSGATVGSLLLILVSFGASAADRESEERHDEDKIDEIIVQGAALERTIKELAQPTTVVAGNSLARKQATSIGETLSHELGVSSTYFGPVSSRPVIRGQSGERILMLSNGLEALDVAGLSDDHAVSIDSVLADHIEIIRGPATLLYGSGAAGGLVNVVDKRINERPLDEPFSGTLSLGNDSATGKQSGAARIAAGTERIAFNLDYFRLDTDDVEIPGYAESGLYRALEEEEHAGEEEAYGVIENTSSRTEGGAAGITLTGDYGFLGVSVSQYDSNYGVPGHAHHEEEPGAAIEEHGEEVVRIDLEQTRVDVRGAYDFSNAGQLELRFAANDYTHSEIEGDEIGTSFFNEGTDTRLEYQHRPIGNMEGAFGVQFKDVDFLASGEEAYVPPSVTRQASLFAFEEWALDDQWTLQASIRGERQTIDSAGLPGYDDDAFGGSVGAIWRFADEYSLALYYSLAERHPNATELYADGPHIAERRIELGSVTSGDGILGLEQSSNLDVTLRGENGRFGWTVTGFVNAIDDYILLARTDQVVDELPVYEYRQTDATLRGFEAEARLTLMYAETGDLDMRLYSDYVRGKDDRTGFDLPQLPPWRFGVGLNYRFDRFETEIEAEYNDAVDDTAPFELPTAAYTLLSAGVSYDWEQPDILLFVRGTNLLNEEARQNTSQLKDIAPLPGRSIQLGLQYDF